MILMRVVLRQDAQYDKGCTCAKGLVVEGTVAETEDLSLYLVTLPLFGGALATLVCEKMVVRCFPRNMMSVEHGHVSKLMLAMVIPFILSHNDVNGEGCAQKVRSALRHTDD